MRVQRHRVRPTELPKGHPTHQQFPDRCHFGSRGCLQADSHPALVDLWGCIPCAAAQETGSSRTDAALQDTISPGPQVWPTQLWQSGPAHAWWQAIHAVALVCCRQQVLPGQQALDTPGIRHAQMQDAAGSLPGPGGGAGSPGGALHALSHCEGQPHVVCSSFQAIRP